MRYLIALLLGLLVADSASATVWHYDLYAHPTTGWVFSATDGTVKRRRMRMRFDDQAGRLRTFGDGFDYTIEAAQFWGDPYNPEFPHLGFHTYNLVDAGGVVDGKSLTPREFNASQIVFLGQHNYLGTFTPPTFQGWFYLDDGSTGELRGLAHVIPEPASGVVWAGLAAAAGVAGLVVAWRRRRRHLLTNPPPTR